MFPFTGLNVQLNLQPQRQDLILKQIQLMKTPLAYLTGLEDRSFGTATEGQGQWIVARVAECVLVGVGQNWARGRATGG